MSYAIVGFGKIGQALARAFARKNFNVTVASRQPLEEPRWAYTEEKLNANIS